MFIKKSLFIISVGLVAVFIGFLLFLQIASAKGVEIESAVALAKQIDINYSDLKICTFTIPEGRASLECERYHVQNPDLDLRKDNLYAKSYECGMKKLVESLPELRECKLIMFEITSDQDGSRFITASCKASFNFRSFFDENYRSGFIRFVQFDPHVGRWEDGVYY